MARIPLLFLSAIVISSCSHYSLIEPKRYAIAGVYSIEPQISWSAEKKGKIEIWTVDGPLLQSVFFVKGLDDGETLFEVQGDKELPKFKPYMSANEIMEFIVDSLSSIDMSQVKATNLRPIKFGNTRGGRFELAFLTKDGLEMEGTAVGAVLQEHLHLIMYYGTRQYYFPRHKPYVEKLIDSVRML